MNNDPLIIKPLPYQQLKSLLEFGESKEDGWDYTLSVFEEVNSNIRFDRMFDDPSKYIKGGYAPVQLSGTIAIQGQEHSFYFKSRWSTAQLRVGNYPELEEEFDKESASIYLCPRYIASAIVSKDDFGGSWLNPSQSVLALGVLHDNLIEISIEECRRRIKYFRESTKRIRKLIKDDTII